MSELLSILGSLRPVLRMRTVQGDPVTLGEHRLVPVARSVLVGIGRPGGSLAAGWARTQPLAVLDTYRGETRRIPIPDPTRAALMALAATVFVVTLVARYAARSSQRARAVPRRSKRPAWRQWADHADQNSD